MSENTENCIFCNIIQKRAKAKIVYEDDDFLAFEDARPVAPVHTLIISKTHIEDLTACEDTNILGGLLLTANKVAKIKGVYDKGFKILINVKRKGGQTVFHLHIHLLGGMNLGHIMKALWLIAKGKIK